MTRSNLIRPFLAGLTVALAACGGGTGAGMNGPPPPQSPSPSVKLASAQQYGNYLVDGNGRTLYLFARDLPAGGGNGAISSCNGSSADNTSCVYFWPIFHAASNVVQGIDPNDLGEINRTDGLKQTTYKGWPLYYFVNDTSPGDIKGEAIAGWFVLRSPFYTVMTLIDGQGTTRLVDASGRSLYRFAQDAAGPVPISACAGTPGDRTTCVGNWPIFSVPSVIAPSAIGAGQLTSFTRDDGKQQLAFNGQPLYDFVDDRVPGDLKGLTFGPGLGFWFTVDPTAQ